MTRHLRLHHQLEHRLMDEETYDCKERLADLAGFPWQWKSYGHYVAHYVLMCVTKEERAKQRELPYPPPYEPENK